MPLKTPDPEDRVEGRSARAVFDAGMQRYKVWLVVLVCFLCAGGMIFAGGYLFRHYGLQPDDGGVLKPLSSRVLVGSAFALPGAAIAAAILAYLQCYVTRIEADDAGGGFRVRVAGLGGDIPVHPGDVVRAGFNEGELEAGGLHVNAPWYSVRLRGRRLPLIVDLQGDFLDEHAVERLVAGKPAPPVGAVPDRGPGGRKVKR